MWFYYREQTFDGIENSYKIGNKIADAAAQMTDTAVTRRVLGTAAPQNFNRPLAEAAYKNITAVEARSVLPLLEAKVESRRMLFVGTTPRRSQGGE